MPAGRPFDFPDPDDVTPKKPSTIAYSDQVLGLYNQSPENENMQKVSSTVKSWFEKAAKEKGWDEASFIDSDCLLTNEKVKSVRKNH